MTRRRVPRASFPCPNCGADVPSGARACRECGSDDRTGWQDSEEIDYQSIDLPESIDEPQRASSGTPAWIAVTAAVLVVVLVALLTSGLW